MRVRAGRLAIDIAAHADALKSSAAPETIGACLHASPAMRIAYLTNVYPKVSHTFIRDEIHALERIGFEIMRLTIRKPHAPLPDAVDRAEADRTIALLDVGPLAFAHAIASRFLQHPLAFIASLWMALSMGWRGAAGIARGLAYFVEACLLSTMLARAGVHHVHVHFGTNPASVALLARRLGGPTYSLTVHGPDEFDAPGALHLREKIADASFAVAISHHGRGQLMRWSRVADWPRIALVRCGASPRFHHRSDVGLSSRTLVCVARLSAQKGLSVLIEATAIVARAHPFQLRIIGDGEMRAEIEAHIAARGLGDHIHLLGWQSTDSVRREIEAARALVVPSFAEGLPVVIMEAFALGRPVIATAIAGIPELVDTTTGWLVPTGSADALAEAMDEMLCADIGTLQAKTAHGRARVAAQHDVDASAATLATLLRPWAVAR
ncbi:glycosyltransferase family 4 protein [Hephaestia sp. GCM10023244]|uniref:glycosyltransferase family 4 protein n=1 Tax=unclassified Hephaestia TaxID=2631281 RepID=UPI0020773D8B|nr:glycosyltransferase family 4 protein [Hephaestia sp. MAHUQ-44]